MRYKNTIRTWGDVILYASGDYDTDEHRYVVEFKGQQIACEQFSRDAIWMCIHNFRLPEAELAALKVTWAEKYEWEYGN